MRCSQALVWPALLCVLVTVLLPAPALLQTAVAVPAAETLPADTLVERVVADTEGLAVAMAFAPDGRLFFTVKGGFGGERDAQVRVVEHGALRPTPFLVTRANTDGERGLLGIALDPAFASNRYVYIFKTAPASETGTGWPANRVIRYTEDPATQTAIPGSATLLLDVPIGPENDPNTNHNGGNLHFGPDGKLYVTVGDYGRNRQNAQDLRVPMGKIHRLNPDGSVPADNPFVGRPGVRESIWSYGHRNSFDFTFDPLSGRMFFTENGPGCDDEVNLGQAGGNYGWPNQCGEVPEGTIAPLYRFSEPIAITGIDVYRGPISGWSGSLFWCGYKTGQLFRGQLDQAQSRMSSVTVVNGAFDCGTDVLRGPDGALYVAGTRSIWRIRSTAQRCFTETGACLDGRFLAYWEQNGALAVFGYPIAPAGDEFNADSGATHRTQWFERTRLELHPENAAPYDVLLGRIGNDRLVQLGVNWQALPREDGPQADCLWFAETGHNVCDQASGPAGSIGFKSFWLAHGIVDPALKDYQRSLALFGLPLTEPRMETNSSGDTVLTQWFERARFEWHPHNPDEYKVLLGLLGREVWAAAEQGR